MAVELAIRVLHVLGQPSVAAEAGEAALHDPALGQDDEAAGPVAALDDGQRQALVACRDRRDLAPIAAVGERQLQPSTPAASIRSAPRIDGTKVPSKGEAAADPCQQRGQPVAVLGLLFTALGFVTDACFALAAGTAGNWLKRSRGYLTVERYVSGVLFIGLGVTAAFAANHRK